MACGTPVIGSNVGGIKYSVQDGKTGFLVPPNDPKALAEKVDLLISDEALMAALRENSIKRVNTYFTWSKVSVSVAALYKRIEVPAIQTAQKSENTIGKKSQAA
jgi:glycosyltransferase involved in cell wall biosynthesis